MQEDDVAGSDLFGRARGVRDRDVAVVSGLALSEIALVTGHTVQTIVDPLGDGEELLISLDHEPTDIDVRIEHVADEHQEHLGHATACGGRVDVPDGLASKLFAGHRHSALELLKAIVPDKRLEPRQRVPGHLDLSQGRPCRKGPVMGRQDNDPPSPVPPTPGTGELGNGVSRPPTPGAA